MSDGVSRDRWCEPVERLLDQILIAGIKRDVTLVQRREGGADRPQQSIDREELEASLLPSDRTKVVARDQVEPGDQGAILRNSLSAASSGSPV